MILLALGRALGGALAVTLALGSGGASTDYVAAGQLAASAPTLRAAAVLGDAAPYAAAGQLTAAPATVRAAALLGPGAYAAAARLSVAAATLRGTAQVEATPYASIARLQAPAPRVVGAAGLLRNTYRGTSGGAWLALVPCDGHGVALPYAPAATLDPQTGSAWGPAAPLALALAAAWQQRPALDDARALAWRPASPLDEARRAACASRPARDLTTAILWTELDRLDLAFRLPYAYPPARDLPTGLSWSALTTRDDAVDAVYAMPPPKDRRHQSFPWGPGGPPDYRVPPPQLPAVNEAAPVLVRGAYVCMDLHRPLAGALDVALRLRRPLRSYCDSGTFIVNNHLAVITLADGLPLDVLSVSMKTDIGSFVWDLSLTLATADGFDRVRPSPAQDGAREIEISCNGYVWRGFVDAVSLSREFGNPSYSAQGKSFSAYGAQPFAPLRSSVSTADRLTQQIANDAFEYLGFAITWDALDWVVPAGLFAYENKDPMAAVAQLCAAAGLFILPGRFDKSFIVRSRYPTTIWHWDDPTTASVAAIPLNMMISAASRFQAGTDFNKVYVGGTQVGNTVACTRDQTAGDSIAPSVVDALLATDAAAIERGRIELCKAGARIFNTYVTPLVPVSASGVHLREVGELVAVDEAVLDDQTYKGLITSLSVSASRSGSGELTVYQTIEVERHV